MTLRIAMLILIPISALAGSPTSSDQRSIEDVSYALGYKFGERIQKEITDLVPDEFAVGFINAYTGNVSGRMTEEEMKAVISAYQEKRISEMREESQVKAEENGAEGKAFLARNARKQGVVTTVSGLQYEVLTKGAGPSPKASDIVKARYHGTLLDGTVFDSTRERDDEPAEFPLDRVIPGWTEGLQLMRRGAKFKFYVPPELAYGKRGAGPRVGPNQVLIFDVELVDFQAK